MKKKRMAICLAAVLGLAPCGVSASQENASELTTMQASETAQAEIAQTQTAQTEELQEEEQTVEANPFEKETKDASTEATEEIESTEATESTETIESTESTEAVEATQTVETEETTKQEETVETKQNQTEELLEEEVLSSEAQTQETVQLQGVLGAAPEGDGAYFGECDENDLFWANRNAQGEVSISQVQLLRSMLAKVGKGYSQSMRYDQNYYDCSSLILRCLQEFGLSGVPYSTYDWNNRLQGKQVGDVITFHGNGNYVSYKLTAVNTNEISNPDAFLVPGTIIVLIEPGYGGGHVAVSLGSFARQDNGLDPSKNAVAIVNQTRAYVASQLASRYGADQALLMGNNFISGYANTWMDSSWLGTDMLAGDAYSGTYNRIWRVEAFNSSTGVCVTNVARGTNGLMAKYVLTPVDTDTRLEENLSVDQIRVSNVSPKGYQVDVTFSATYGASRVLMPTWTENNGQDDLIWHTAKVEDNTASFYVKASDHNGEGGRYITHIYLYGQTGKYCIAGTQVQLPVREIKDYNGFHKETDGASYYYSNGKLAGDYTGLVLDKGVWYYIKEGKLDVSYTGLVFHCGNWYYVEKGILNWNYSGLVRYSGRWYHVQKGYLNWNYSGLVEYYGTVYYVYKGELNWGYYGLVYDNAIWQFVRGGRLDKSYTGLVKHAGGWYYVDKGSVDWNYTGPVEYYGTCYYIRNGYLNWTYSGSVEINGTVREVKNGVVIRNNAL